MRKLLLVLSLLAMPFLFFCPNLFGQTTDSITIQKADFRGNRPQSAVVAATSASSNNVIVVLVRGADKQLIEETEGNIRGLIFDGYSRIGLILSDSFTDEEAPVISIFSNGSVYAVIENADLSAATNLDFYKLVCDAYKTFTVSEE